MQVRTRGEASSTQIRIAQRVSAVSSEPFRLALKLPKDVIRLSVGEPDFDTPDFVKEAAKRAIDEGFTHYSPATGFDELKEAVAEKLRSENGISYDYNNEVLITPGSSSGIYLALLALLDPGDEVLVPDPAWFHYTTLIRLCGARPIGVPVKLGDDEASIEPDEVEKLVNERTKVLIINSPNNPTGMVLSRHNIETLGELAEKHDLTVISDEVYEKIIYPSYIHLSPASMAGLRERTITSNGFSKAYAMTGWRVGYIAGPSEIIEKIVALNGYILVCASSVSQRAAYVALTDQRMKKAIKEMVERFSQRRKTVVEMLAEVSSVTAFPPQGTFYTWVDVGETGLSGEEFAMRLIDEQRVSVLPGILFGESGQNCIRISFATQEDLLKEGLKRFHSFVSQLG